MERGRIPINLPDAADRRRAAFDRALEADMETEGALFGRGLGPLAGVLSLVAILFIAIWMDESPDLAWSPPELKRQQAWYAALNRAPSHHALDDSSRITLERTSCFGSCPAYSITLHGSGRVEYQGRLWVCDVAPQTRRVDPAQISRLITAMIDAEFFVMSDELDRDWTDGFTVTTSLRHAGREHVVRHYHGDADAPRLLAWMEDRIDAVAGSSRWLPGYANGGYRCAGPRGQPLAVEWEDFGARPVLSPLGASRARNVQR